MSTNPQVFTPQSVPTDSDPAISPPKRKGGWQKGQSGNPSGRPKYALVSAALRAKIAKVSARGDVSGAERLANRMFKIALEGKDNTALTAITEIRDTTEGKPTQSIRMALALDENTARRLAELAARMCPVVLDAEIIEQSGTKQLTDGDPER